MIIIKSPIFFIATAFLIFLIAGCIPSSGFANGYETKPETDEPWIAGSPVSSQPGLRYGVRQQNFVSSGGFMPFWLHSNNHDILGMEGYRDDFSAENTGYEFLTNIFGSWTEPLGRGFSLRLRSDVLLRHGLQDSEIRLQEAFGEITYGGFYLYGGRKREQFGMLHPQLSLGTMDWSANARPMTKIGFGTDGHRPVPWTRDYLFYDAYIAHGWMSDNDTRFVQDPWMHQKYLYLRVFEEDHIVTLHGGMSHYVMWGGYSPRDGDMRQDFKAFVDVFISRAGDRETMFENIIGTGWLDNHMQNHGGIYDFMFSLNLDDYRFRAGRQFMLEDTPNYRFAAPWDGIWSVSFERTSGERHLFDSAVYEHINTLDQLRSNPKREGRTANYYNHSNYGGGWTYHGRVIGNPLYFSYDHQLGVANNELVGHHVGFSGFLGDLAYRTLATYSRNYGARRSFEDRSDWPRKDQYSFMVELQYNFRQNWTAHTSIGADAGDLYKDKVGIMLGVSWQSR